MAYEVVLLGRAEGALRAALSNRLGADAIIDADGAFTLLIRDRSALMGVLEQLHGFNISVETVRHIESS